MSNWGNDFLQLQSHLQFMQVQKIEDEMWIAIDALGILKCVDIMAGGFFDMPFIIFDLYSARLMRRLMMTASVARIEITFKSFQAKRSNYGYQLIRHTQLKLIGEIA